MEVHITRSYHKVFLLAFSKKDISSWVCNNIELTSCVDAICHTSFSFLAGSPVEPVRTRVGFLRKNIVAVSFFQNYAIPRILNTYVYN